VLSNSSVAVRAARRCTWRRLAPTYHESVRPKKWRHIGEQLNWRRVTSWTQPATPFSCELSSCCFCCLGDIRVCLLHLEQEIDCSLNWVGVWFESNESFTFRLHRLHAVHGCGLVLQILRVICVCVSVCWALRWALEKWLYRSRCHLGARLCGLRNCAVDWDPVSYGRGIFWGLYSPLKSIGT